MFDGWALSSPSGGYPGVQGYSYNWVSSDGQNVSSEALAANLPALLSYTVTVTDMNNCSNSGSTDIFTQPLLFAANITTTNYIESIKDFFFISPVLFIVPAIVILMIVKKINPVISLFVGTILAALFALIFQSELISNIINQDSTGNLSTYMIIMDAIACGLDINKLIKEKGNSTWIYEYWHSYRNEGYYYNEDWNDSREWVGGKKGFLKKSDKNTYVPLMFRPSLIPLEKYKHLKPRSGKDFGRMNLSNLQTRSFSVKDLKD